MNFAGITSWVEEHPTESIVIGAGGVLVVLWLLGAFSSSGSSDAGASNLASAYYAAEAQQAVVGGQIQMATIQSAAATAQNAAQVNGAVAINKAQTKAAVTINGQNASAATTINQSNNDANIVGSNNQLLATYSNNSTAYETAKVNTAAQVTMNQSNNNSNQMIDFINSILPAEMVRAMGGAVNVYTPFGNLGLTGQGSPANTPQGLIERGYSAADAQRLASPQGSA